MVAVLAVTLVQLPVVEMVLLAAAVQVVTQAMVDVVVLVISLL
jgi:hypothetical protein